MWGPVIPGRDEQVYRKIDIAKQGRLSSKEFEWIGRWKDGAWADGRWKPNVASVAYDVWMQAAKGLPSSPSQPREFLDKWSSREYEVRFRNGILRTMHFGPPEASTFLHFISAGRYPIFDARVRAAIEWLVNSRVGDATVEWYQDSFCLLFSEIGAVCETEDVRRINLALVRYGQFFKEKSSIPI
jgi:hypothetical protein